MLNAKIKIFKKFRKEIEENIYVILEWVENSFKQDSGASLVVQWLRIQLAMQGTRVWPSVREDPTCCGAAKPVHHGC